jgi:hypothetical protein
MALNYDQLLELFKSKNVEYLAIYENNNLSFGTLIHITPAGKIVCYNGKALAKRKTWEGEVLYKFDEGKKYYTPYRKPF